MSGYNALALGLPVRCGKCGRLVPVSDLHRHLMKHGLGLVPRRPVVAATRGTEA